MIPKKSVKPHQAASEQSHGFRPRVVFSRDEASGSDKSTDPASSVLIVEDDYLVASQAETALQDAGFNVTGIAVTAEEAIALARAQKPSLVVMDIRLLGKRDGIDAAIELFREQGIRCIFASAHTDRQVRARGEAASPLGWLQKPYTMRSLVEMVRNSLRQ